MVKWSIIIPSALTGVVAIVSIATKTFNGWAFFGLLIILSMFTGFYLFLKTNYLNKVAEQGLMDNRRKSFEYTWKRVNEILRSMDDGQGISWASGVDRSSQFTTIFDGIQNKSYRSVFGKLENSQDNILVIYNIDDDTIDLFQTSFTNQQLVDHFHGFSVKSGGQSFGNGMGGYDRPFGNNSGGDRFMQPSYHGSRRMTIDFDNDYNSMEGQYRTKEKPTQGVVDNVVDNLNKK